MFAQTVIVGVIVVACTAYAVWSLMPSTTRRRVATVLIRLPLPEPVAAPLRRAALSANACGCNGCDGGAPRRPATAEQRVRFRPRRH
jgi:hypothetical protein